MRPLILIGGGGHCRSVIEAAESEGRKIKGILDLPESVGDHCLGYPVIDTDSNISRYVNECDFLVTVGFIKDATVRNKLHTLIKNAGGKLTTLIASSANVSRYAKIGDGTVILHNATVNAGAKVGKGCIINTGAIIEHDTVIEDYCHVSTGAVVNGGCHIHNTVFIGSGAVIANGIKVAGGSVLGAGTVVCKNIIEKGLYVGVPAKRIR